MLNILINTAHAAVSLPNLSASKDLPAFISSIYSFSLTIVGIAVFIRILYGGFKLLTAAGNTGKIGDAKSIITNAVIGAILLFAAYLILYVINPDLVKNTFNFTLPKATTSSVFNNPTTTTPTKATAALSGVTGSQPTGFNNVFPIAHAQEGVYAFAVKVLDASGDTCTQSYNLEVISSLQSLRNEDKMVVQKNSEVPIAHADDDCTVWKSVSVAVSPPIPLTPTSTRNNFAPERLIGICADLRSPAPRSGRLPFPPPECFSVVPAAVSNGHPAAASSTTSPVPLETSPALSGSPTAVPSPTPVPLLMSPSTRRNILSHAVVCGCTPLPIPSAAH